MAVSAKTHTIALQNPQCSKPQRPKTLKNFSLNPTNLQISLKRTRNLSAIDPDSINTSNINSDTTKLCLQGNLEQALKHLDYMVEHHVPVAEETYICLIRLCEWKRVVPEGVRVYAVSSNSITLFSIRLGNALLSMLVRFGKLLDAWFVFGKMEERDLFSWNVMVGGYAKAGFFDEALNLYHRMLWVGIKPDIYTFPCVLRTCGGVPDLDRGREIHAHVIRFRFESDVDVNNALITMYAKSRDVYSGRRVFDVMTRRDQIS